MSRLNGHATDDRSLSPPADEELSPEEEEFDAQFEKELVYLTARMDQSLTRLDNPTGVREFSRHLTCSRAGQSRG